MSSTSGNSVRAGVLIALIAAIPTVLVGYWQYGSKSEQQKAEQVKFFNFRGRVVDKKTGNEVRRAKVTLEAQGSPSVEYSDSEGFFLFPLKETDTQVRIRVDVDNYEQHSRIVSPSPSAGVVEIQIQPLQSLPNLSNSPSPSISPTPPVSPVPSTPTDNAETNLSASAFFSAPSPIPFEWQLATLTSEDSDAEINVRSGAGKDFRNLHYGVPGDKVTVIDVEVSKNGSKWYKVRFDSEADGWVHENFVDFKK
jgi:hypothetical protein